MVVVIGSNNKWQMNLITIVMVAEEKKEKTCFNYNGNNHSYFLNRSMNVCKTNEAMILILIITKKSKVIWHFWDSIIHSKSYNL
jgi:hypothetical protein